MNYILDSLTHLRDFCEKEDFKGWDPFDGLSSRLFQRTFLKEYAWARIVWLQFFKRSPVNLRSFLRITKDYNPKGLALFLSGYTYLYRAFADQSALGFMKDLTRLLKDHQSPGYAGACWGYPFDWQSRAFFVPKGTPNVIVSTFSGHALLDAYEQTGEEELRETALSVADFIKSDLKRSVDDAGNVCFSYTPLDRSQIINASLLASAFLARVSLFRKDPALLEDARSSVAFCCRLQNLDGSWFYGTRPNQRWVDSFHTAYNLEALYRYQLWSHDSAFQKNFKAGLDYYWEHFFTPEGVPKYYNNKIYPVDVHATASLVALAVTAGLMKERATLIENVLCWTIRHMQTSSGFFCYQRERFYRITIPYMRWSQAWMFFALSYYLFYLKTAGTVSRKGEGQ